MNADLPETFTTFQINLHGNANSFVKCWSSLYNYSDYEKYRSIVTKTFFSEGDLRTLFEWKNGMNLSSKKESSFINKILQHKDLINQLKQEFDKDKFQKSFGGISAIWQTFLLHILQPDTCPIFDQHVYRAFQYIKYRHSKELPVTRNAKLKIYSDEYKPFFSEMKKLANKHDHFEIDKALWTFGKLVKDYPGFLNIAN